MAPATLILACGDPFRNIGPIGWALLYAFLAGLGISCLLAIVNPLLVITMKTDRRWKRFHVGVVVAYLLPGLAFALCLAAGWNIGGEVMIWFWLIYFCLLPLWAMLHFVVLLCKRRQLRLATLNFSMPTG